MRPISDSSLILAFLVVASASIAPRVAHAEAANTQATPASASAETPSTAAPSAEETAAKTEEAKKLFAEGRRLSGEALYDQACPMLEQSLKLDERASTQFNLAECWERQGRLASAHALYLKVAERMLKAGEAEREKIARRRADLLENRLCGLSIDPEKAEPNMEILLGNDARGTRSIEPALWGAVMPVDADTYTLTARAPGMKAWSTEVEVEACPTLVSVPVPKLLPDQHASAKPAAVPTPAKQETPPSETASEGSSRFPVVPVVFAGVGVGAVTLGGVFASKYGSKNDAASAICPQGSGCTPDEVEEHAKLVDEAKTARTWAYVGFGVGTAALLSAGVLYLTGNYDEPAPSQSGWNVSPTALGADRWGATLLKKF